MDIKVINIRTASYEEVREAVYIGRAMLQRKGSPLANPFKTTDHTPSGHEAVCFQYKQRLWDAICRNDSEVMAELTRLLTLARKQPVNSPQTDRKQPLKLACWCKPLPCHGDVIVSCLKWLDKQP